MYTLSELTQGLDLVIKGDPGCIIKGICTIQESQSGYITFLTNPLYRKYLENTQAAAVILSSDDADACPVNALITPNPHYVFSKIAAFFDQKPTSQPGIHPSAVIGQGCLIHPSVSIGAHCVIGDFSEIGEGSQLDANVTIYHHIKIGKRVLIASGTVIGSDGFSIAKHQGKWHKVPQLGSVIIGDDVEIGSNCSIDRGAIGDTVISNGVKLDNLIQIGHNVQIGENTAIAGCVGIAGSAVIGKNCLIGGGAGINGHITLADNVMITGMTAVTKSIREPGAYSSGVGGVLPNLEWRKNSARLHRLDELLQRIKALEKREK